MDTVTVSQKFQVVIPLKVRQRLHILSGQKMQGFAYNNHVVLINVRPIEEARGMLKGLDFRDLREEVDEER